jgi:hypothetical protein
MTANELQPVTRKTYSPKSSEGLKKFIREFPRLPYGLEQFDSFTQHLTSGPDCVLDFWQANQRTAVAVLLDKAKTRADSLEIALMGYRWDFSVSQFLDSCLPLAEKQAREKGLKQIELISSLGLKVGPADLKNRGFVAGPTTITFETSHLNPQLLVSHPAEFVWKDADQQTIGSCYELLSINVSAQDAAYLVPRDKFEQLALHLQLKPRILFSNERPIAFVWVILENSTGQLLFMARHPDYRAKGLGKICLGEANRVLQNTGFKKLQAEVRDTDTAAVKLFEVAGFKTIRKLTRFQLSLK